MYYEKGNSSRLYAASFRMLNSYVGLRQLKPTDILQVTLYIKSGMHFPAPYYL
jgi:hypothetical protein